MITISKPKAPSSSQSQQIPDFDPSELPVKQQTSERLIRQIEFASTPISAFSSPTAIAELENSLELTAHFSLEGTATATRSLASFPRFGFSRPSTLSAPDFSFTLESSANGHKTAFFRIPPLKWPVKAHPILTDRVRNLLQTMWAICVSRASQTHFTLSGTSISVVFDPSEEDSKAVLRLTCRANMVQSLAFWDSLDADFRNWLATLTSRDRNIFLTKISMRVHWL